MTIATKYWLAQFNSLRQIHGKSIGPKNYWQGLLSATRLRCLFGTCATASLPGDVVQPVLPPNPWLPCNLWGTKYLFEPHMLTREPIPPPVNSC